MALFNRRKANKVLIAVFAYCVIFFFLLLFDEYLSNYHRRIYISVYTSLEYFFFSFIIANLIQNTRFRKILIGLSICFYLFQLAYFFSAKFKPIDSVPIGVESILIFSFIIFLLIEEFQKSKTRYIYANAWFWIIIGIMFYLACSFFFNILANFDRKSIRPYWFLTYVFEIIKNVLFVIGIVLYSKKTENKSQQSPIPYLDLI